MAIRLQNVLNRWSQMTSEKNPAVKESSISGNDIRYKPPTTGDVITGKIVDILHHRVSIQLKEGNLLTATMTADMPLSIGDEVSFSVKGSTDKQLTLTPLVSEGSGDAKLGHMLQQLGLDTTDENIAVIKQLVRDTMPIDRQTIAMTKMYLHKYPGSSLSDITFVMKNKMPVNPTTIQYMKDIHQANFNVGKDLTVLSNHLVETSDVSFREEAVQQLFGDKTMQSQLVNRLLTQGQSISVESTVHETVQVDVEPMQQLVETLNIAVSNLTNQIQGNAQMKVPPDVVGRFMDTFEQLLADNEWFSKLPPKEQEQLRTILSKQVALDLVDRELRLDQGALASKSEFKEQMKERYEVIQRLSESLSQLGGEEGKTLSMDAVKVKHSIEVLNQMQQSMQYIHMPMMMNGRQVNGELYVMKRNAQSSKQNQERITAFIRLDLLMLGSLDIHVAKTGKQVEVAFYVEDEETRHFMQENIQALNSLLSKEAFDVLGLGVHIKDRPTDIFTDLIEDTKEQDVGRISFDIRA